MALRPHCYPHAPVGLCPPCSDHAYNAPKLVQEWVIATQAISCTDCSLDLEKCVDIKSFRRSPFMRRSSRLMLLTTLLAAVAGCSSQNHPNAALQAPVVYQTASTPSPSWVFGPSAPLPAGFPKPGPVGEIIIKQYPASRIAIVDRDQRHQGSGGLFMPLFRHIEKNHIAMSSPVVMTYQDSAQDRAVMASMAFVYPSEATGQLQTDGSVKVENVPPMTVVSIGVRGGYTASRFLKASGKLYLWLAEHKSQFTAAGQPRYLAYNSPFVPPPFQFGEVQIPITPVVSTGAVNNPGSGSN